LQIGASLVLQSIGGEFTCFNKNLSDNAKLLFIAGGIGITPLMSMLRGLVAQKSATNATLLYYNRTEEDFIFNDELEASTTSEKPNIKIIRGITSPDPVKKNRIIGRISKEHLNALGININDNEIYICGPEQFIQTTVSLLSNIGVPADRIQT